MALVVVPTHQVLSQKQPAVLSFIIAAKVAAIWWPSDGPLHSLLLWAQAPWDQQYLRGPAIQGAERPRPP
jgi:hypothetical protein